MRSVLHREWKTWESYGPNYTEFRPNYGEQSQYGLLHLLLQTRLTLTETRECCSGMLLRWLTAMLPLKHSWHRRNLRKSEHESGYVLLDRVVILLEHCVSICRLIAFTRGEMSRTSMEDCCVHKFCLSEIHADCKMPSWRRRSKNNANKVLFYIIHRFLYRISRLIAILSLLDLSSQAKPSKKMIMEGYCRFFLGRNAFTRLGVMRSKKHIRW